MRLRKLEAKNFRLFSSLTIDLDDDCPDTLFVAPNGHGKTAVIDAIASALGLIAIEAGMPAQGTSPLQHSDAHKVLTAPPPESGVPRLGNPTYPVRVEATLSVGSETLKLTRGLGTPQSEYNAKAEGRQAARRLLEMFPIGERPIVAYYSTSRFGRPPVPESGDVESPLATSLPDPALVRHAGMLPVQSLSDAYQNAFDRAADWHACRVWISQLIVRHQVEGRLPPPLEAATTALSEALSLKVDPTWVPGWSDLGVLLPDADCLVPYSQLSDGYRVVAGVVVDIVRRVSIACPGMTKESLRSYQGIVLIDELDQHLHPEWQRRIFRDLKRVFPGIQFLATTHAPEILIGAVGVATVLGIERSEDGPSHQARPIQMNRGEGADRVLSGEAFRLISTIDPESGALLRKIAIAYARSHFDEASRQTYEKLRQQAETLNLPSRYCAEERLVLDVIDHVQRTHPGEFDFGKMSWTQLQQLKERAVAALSSALEDSH